MNAMIEIVSKDVDELSIKAEKLKKSNKFTSMKLCKLVKGYYNINKCSSVRLKTNNYTSRNCLAINYCNISKLTVDKFYEELKSIDGVVRLYYFTSTKLGLVPYLVESNE